MSFTDLLIDTLTVYTVSDGTPDRYGNPIDSLDGGTAVAARVEPTTMQELEGGRRDTRIDVLKVLTAIEAIDGTSLVDYNGKRYEVYGNVEVFEDHVGPHHLEFALRKTEG